MSGPVCWSLFSPPFETNDNEPSSVAQSPARQLSPSHTVKLNMKKRILTALVCIVCSTVVPVQLFAQGPDAASKTASVAADLPSGGFGMIDGSGPGWKTLGKDDFVRANCNEDTWVWDGNMVHCTGRPVGVLRSATKYKNVEFVAYWRHLSDGGNSGFFLWTPENALTNLPPDRLPDAGIEVQVLDHGYTKKYESSSGKKATWFTTNGDIFGVGRSKLKPFEPISPDGSRSFPRENHSLGTPQWNHYYVRGINGEVRLWVNGHEVSGGNGADPSEGYLCLESEGAPVEFRDIRIRELP